MAGLVVVFRSLGLLILLLAVQMVPVKCKLATSTANRAAPYELLLLLRKSNQLTISLSVRSPAQISPPTVLPASDQNVPNNAGNNVTFSCGVANDLNLVWEVDNLQITPRTLPAFQDRGITTDGVDGSVLVFTDAVSECGL